MTGITMQRIGVTVLMLGIIFASTMPASAVTSTGRSAIRAKTYVYDNDGAHVIRTARESGAQAIRTVRGSRVTPAIEVESCTSSRATWVHVYSPEGLQCFGYTGEAFWSPWPELYTFCAGNNHGSFIYYDANNGKTYTSDFYAGFGSDFAPGIYIESVTINGWSGSDKC